jgi:hypothetical protein
MLYISELDDSLNDESTAIFQLLKPDFTFIEKSGESLMATKETVPSDISKAVKYNFVHCDLPPAGIFYDGGSQEVLDRCKRKKICLSSGEPDLFQRTGKWFAKVNGCTYFHPGQAGPSLAFVFFELDYKFEVINAYHPHAYLRFYRGHAKGIPAL